MGTLQTIAFSYITQFYDVRNKRTLLICRIVHES
jgi:hypothetical protein